MAKKKSSSSKITITKATTVKTPTIKSYTPSKAVNAAKSTLQKTEKDAETAAQITALLWGEVHDARRDVLLANAAAALWVSGQVERLADGVCLAATRLDRGDGARRLEALQALHRDAVREKG